MLCPMRTDDKGRMGRCEEGACAWFVRKDQEGHALFACALAFIAAGSSGDCAVKIARE